MGGGGSENGHNPMMLMDDLLKATVEIHYSHLQISERGMKNKKIPGNSK